mgnify:CR=1 FL=1
MKKIIAWALSLILCLCALPVLAEEDAGETEIPEDILEEIEAALAEAEAQREEDPVPSPVGEWYALDDGLAVKLTLKEDGGYILIYPAFPEERTEGAWTLDDGFVYLDLDEDAVFSFDVDRLACHWLSLSFTREPVEDYAPADIIADALPEMFQGAWLTAYTLENGAALPQSWTEDDTRIYVEQNTAVLTGSLFGELIVGLSIENGAEEVAEVEIKASYMPDDYNKGEYEALEVELTGNVLNADNWMTEFSSDLAQLTTATSGDGE